MSRACTGTTGNLGLLGLLTGCLHTAQAYQVPALGTGHADGRDNCEAERCHKGEAVLTAARGLVWV